MVKYQQAALDRTVAVKVVHAAWNIETRERFEESYWRAAAAYVDGKTFADAFYDRFLASSDEIRALFGGTDFEIQKRMFLLSILYVSSLYGKPRPGRLITTLAERHRSVGVRPEMFGTWRDCLLETVRVHDPDSDEAVLEAWRAVMEPGVEYVASVCA